MSYGISFVIEKASLFNDAYWSYEKDAADLSESFKALIDAMGVCLGFNWMDKHLWDVEIGEGDVHVFFAPETDEFIMLDLYFGSGDHTGMMDLAVHFNASKKVEIENIMRNIHDEACAKMGIKFHVWHDDELMQEIDISKYPRRIESYLQNIFYHR